MKKKIYKIVIATTFCFAFMYNFQIESKKTDDSLVFKNFIATAKANEPLPIEKPIYLLVYVVDHFECWMGGTQTCSN